MSHAMLTDDEILAAWKVAYAETENDMTTPLNLVFGRAVERLTRERVLEELRDMTADELDVALDGPAASPPAKEEKC